MDLRAPLVFLSVITVGSLLFAGCSSGSGEPSTGGSSSGSGGSSSSGSSSSGSSSGSTSSSGSSSGAVDAGGDGDHCQGCGEGGGPSDAAPFEAAGPGEFGASCTSDEDCQSDDCWDFPGKGGMFCTMSCEAGTCPDGCNNMGQCKVP